MRILAVQAGLFGAPGTEAVPFTPSGRLPLRDGQVFGWRMKVDTHQRRIHVREELTLPREPKTWGDPEPDLKRKTSPDGRTATTEVLLQPENGYIFHTWAVTQGDPEGTWIIKVFVEGQPERVLRLEAH